ncbi:RNA polymerase sigma factor [Vibrio parahaemolyticus]|uniref:RNA polymerase sigma factor n=2 Tax=Vibrio TaxID=662 RepID=UPI000423E5A3|nr:RNA polymerase sigma factor [Vibrio parahaemolyticus]AYF20643.1 RNA polymerase sigma-70 factor, ECF subfamily [Vibrio parahaemolyticus]EGQ7891661.1 RNA polymerase sigma factor [Vibrio parahaemolyticus]EGQ8477581.1 RNA polymerase sigma factor [Vibrio parahaemolyticus]EGQ9148115.1 RNA polymerase sigma factor [Vibrio parahaemolyticus]EGQ9456010.1 RNA polymerase sigma factor [Vibrio parahaemolyticus]
MMSDSPQKLGRNEWNAYMDKVKAKDREAFAFVFRFYAPKLKQFAYKHVGNEQVAMEMVQETMATVWQKAHLYDGKKSALSTWVYTIIRNLCFDLLRKQKGKELHIHSDDIWPSEYYPPDLVDHYSPEQDMLKEQVVKFLDILPKNQRDVLQAVYLEELPHQQVAELFDIPLGTVKSRLRLAVEKLRHSMHTEQL